MLNKKPYVVSLIFLVLFTGSYTRAKDSEDKLIDDLYVKSGFDMVVKNFPDALKLSIDEQTALIDKSNGITKEYFKNVNNLLYKSFDPLTLGAIIKSDLKQQLSIDDINYLMDFLNTPLGIKATKLEVESSSSQSMKNFNKYLSNISANPVPESRKVLLKKFEELLNTLDYTVDVTINMQLAMTAAISYHYSAESNLDLTDIKNKLVQSKPLLKSALEPMIIPFLHFTYKDLSNDELKQYISFYEQDKSKHVIRIINDSYLKAITRGSFQFGENIADFIKNRDAQKEA